MKQGDTVYTINNKSNEIDSWTFEGKLKTPTELLCHLTRGKQYCFIPARCVFATEDQAREVIKKFTS